MERKGSKNKTYARIKERWMEEWRKKKERRRRRRR